MTSITMVTEDHCAGQGTTGTVVGRGWAYELCDLVVLRGEHRVVLARDELRHALRRAHLSAEAARRSRVDILRTHIHTVRPE